MFIKDNNNLFLLEELIKKNFSSKYKGSFLGIFWSFLRPLLVMILLTIIFSTVFGGQIENYPVYVLSGKCIYDFFSIATTSSLSSLKGNQNILKRTPVPKHIFILASVFTEFINFLITLIILFGVMIVTNAEFNFLLMILAVIPVTSLIMMLIGLGFIFSLLNIKYTDTQHLWGVITLAAMYASAIFYPMNIIPEPFYSYLLLNPLYWIIDQFRDFIYLQTIPDILNIFNSLTLSFIIFILGVIIFKKYEDKIIMKL